MRRIGVLTPLAAEDPEHKARLAAFAARAAATGLGRSGATCRSTRARARGDADRARGYAAELVALTPDVILATGGSVVGPLLKVTRSCPDCVHAEPPIRSALVSSIAWRDPAATPLASPCLNTAPVENGWSCLKRSRQASRERPILRDAAIPQGSGQFGAIQSVAPSFGVELRPVDLRDATEIERAVRGIRTIPKRQLDRHSERVGKHSSRTNHRARSPVSPPGRLFSPLVRS